MPNMTGAFMDQSPDNTVDVEPSLDTLEEVADDYPYAGLHMAAAQATPDAEFMVYPVKNGPVSWKFLNKDLARKAVTLQSVNGNLVVSVMNPSAILTPFPTLALAIGQPLPMYILPANYPVRLETQEELWVSNWNTSAVDYLSVAVERYSER